MEINFYGLATLNLSAIVQSEWIWTAARHWVAKKLSINSRARSHRIHREKLCWHGKITKIFLYRIKILALALAKHRQNSTEGKAIFYRHLSSTGESFALDREPTRQGVDVESAMRNNKCPIFFLLSNFRALEFKARYRWTRGSVISAHFSTWYFVSTMLMFSFTKLWGWSRRWKKKCKIAVSQEQPALECGILLITFDEKWHSFLPF